MHSIHERGTGLAWMSEDEEKSAKRMIPWKSTLDSWYTYYSTLTAHTMFGLLNNYLWMRGLFSLCAPCYCFYWDILTISFAFIIFIHYNFISFDCFIYLVVIIRSLARCMFSKGNKNKANIDNNNNGLPLWICLAELCLIGHSFIVSCECHFLTFFTLSISSSIHFLNHDDYTMRNHSESYV